MILIFSEEKIRGYLKMEPFDKLLKEWISFEHSCDYLD